MSQTIMSIFRLLSPSEIEVYSYEEELKLAASGESFNQGFSAEVEHVSINEDGNVLELWPSESHLEDIVEEDEADLEEESPGDESTTLFLFKERIRSRESESRLTLQMAHKIYKYHISIEFNDEEESKEHDLFKGILLNKKQY